MRGRVGGRRGLMRLMDWRRRWVGVQVIWFGGLEEKRVWWVVDVGFGV